MLIKKNEKNIKMSTLNARQQMANVYIQNISEDNS